MTVTTIALANEFSTVLRGWLGKDIAVVIERNAAETDPTICHSHDLVDANLAMLDAYLTVVGTPGWTGPDEGLWNAAWNLAKSTDFSTA